MESDEVIETTITRVPEGALSELNRSEIDVQIATAKRYPRSIERFRQNVLTVATIDEETAQSMFYAIPRDGKWIKGPSVRMAEIVAMSWGNLRCGARIIDVDAMFVTAQGACIDLENNVQAAVEVKRRIRTKDGRRFSDDMIQVTANAACSIALRQAVFKVVPMALVKPVYEKIERVALGNEDTFAENRKKCIEYFLSLGVAIEDILAVLERECVEDITAKDVMTLRGIAVSLRDGETTIAESFSRVEENTRKRRERERASFDPTQLRPGAEENRGHGNEGFDNGERE